MNLFSPWAFYGEGDGGPTAISPQIRASLLNHSCRRNQREWCYFQDASQRHAGCAMIIILTWLGPPGQVGILHTLHFQVEAGCETFRAFHGRAGKPCIGGATPQRSSRPDRPPVRGKRRSRVSWSHHPLRLERQHSAVPGSVPRPAYPGDNRDGGPRGEAGDSRVREAAALPLGPPCRGPGGRMCCRLRAIYPRSPFRRQKGPWWHFSCAE